MADNVIDSLSLEISSDSKGADQSIKRLASTLIKLQDSVKGLENINLNGFKNAMLGLRDAMSGFQGTENLEKGITQIQRLSRIEPGNMTAAATGIKDISEAFRGMTGLTIPNLEGVDNLIANLRKFGGISFGNATSYLPKISQSLVNFVEELNRVGSIQFDFTGLAAVIQNISRLGGAKASEAVKNLPSLSRDLVSFVNSLNGIKSLNFDLTGLTGLVSSITKLGSKTATNAVPNITNLATALRQMMATLSTAPKVSQNVIQMAQALSQLATAGGQARTASRWFVASFSSLPAATKKAKSGFSGLAGAIGKFYATYWLLIRGMGQFKKAIDISSDLTEVQNVVDVTFGAMSDKMNEFADSALQNYGMSELMAKQIASRFQAMGVAMGFTQNKMSDMSIELTKLAGDMASFYNVEQEAVAKSLQSVFTGETEPLRKFGLDLTNATIQAWALAQGMDVNVDKMTQAEKTMLRYQYVLTNTGAAQGDFLRTINSWHNQLVLLSGAFQQLGSIVGGVLINAFKPFIQALNSVMGAVINFAQVVSDALGAIFGWEYETGGGVAQDLELGASAAEDIEDATGGAAKKAKELNKYIAAWHEVNNMTTSDDSAGGGGAGGAGGVLGTGAMSGGEWKQAESIWEKYTSDIDSLYKLGEYISNALTSAMNGINWEFVYEGARNFGSGLASFLNGLISPELFGAVGRTIAGALNTAIYAALSFGETFDWINLGKSIAYGVNNFFATFDFAALANTIDVWVQGIWTTIVTAISNIKWGTIWDGIKEFLSEIDLKTVAIIVGAITLKKFGGFVLGGGLAKTIAINIASKIASQLGTTPVISVLTAGIKALFGSTAAQSSLVFMFPKTAAVVSAVQTFFSGTLIPAITTGLSVVGSAIGLSGTAAIAAGGALILGAAVAAVAAIVAAVTHWDEIKNFFGKTIPSWWNGTALPFFRGIPDKLLSVWESVTKSASEKWGEFLDTIRNIPEQVSNTVESIGEWFNKLPGSIGYALGYALGTITKWGIEVSQFFSKKIPEIITNVVKWFSEMPQKIYDSISTFISKAVTWGTNVLNIFKTKTTEIIINVVKWFSELPQKIYDAIIKIKEKITQWGTQAISFFQNEIPKIVNKVIEFFGDLPKRIVDVGENIIKGLWNGMRGAVDWLKDKIGDFCDNVIAGFKKGFDEHSPSKVAFEIGDYFTLGLGNGITDRFKDIYTDIKDFTNDISTMKIDMPQVDLSIPKPDFPPKSYNLGAFQNTMQMEMDARMAEMSYEEQRKNTLLEQILSAVERKELVIGDDAIFNSARRGQQKFQRRTFKTGWAGVD